MALINGFEDVVDYIKKQEQRIMQLEEENKKLKEQLDNETSAEGLDELIIHNLKEENKKLNEENERLKNMIHDTEEFLKVCDRNADGYYKHYETRQIATRFEGGVYELVAEKWENPNETEDGEIHGF